MNLGADGRLAREARGGWSQELGRFHAVAAARTARRQIAGQITAVRCLSPGPGLAYFASAMVNSAQIISTYTVHPELV